MTKGTLKLLLVGALLTASLRAEQPSSATADGPQKPGQLSRGRSPWGLENPVQPHDEGLTVVLPPDTPEIGLAAFKGDINTLRRLISSGVNIESTGRDRRTPLFLACARGHMDAASALLAARANVNTRDVTGATPLHWATQRGDANIVFLLLSHRPEVNVQDDFGVTPLMWAAITGGKSAVEALLAADAKRDLTDVDGLTASDWARKNGFTEIAVLLTKE